MTTTQTISRERLEEIANFKSDLANKPFIYEDARRMARMLLSAMDSEPVAYIIQDKTDRKEGRSGDLSFKSISQHDPQDINEHELTAMPLYAAQPAPVSVPDDATARKEYETYVKSHYQYPMLEIEPEDSGCAGEYVDTTRQLDWQLWLCSWNNCRAAMQSEPVTAATGWIRCSERMPKKGDRILIFIDFNSQAVPPSVHDAEYTGSTFRRGNATVNIYPHEDGFGVTHWMPLPAAPEQEV